MRQSMSDHIDGGLRCFKHEIANEGFVRGVVRRMHIDKKHLVKDGPESCDLDSHRPTYLTVHDLLGCGHNFDDVESFQWG